MEEFDTDNYLHQALHWTARECDIPTPLGLVWNNPSVGNHKPNKREGIAIMQMPDSLLTRRFTVEYTDRSFVLKFLGKIRHFDSDYFEGVDK